MSFLITLMSHVFSISLTSDALTSRLYNVQDSFSGRLHVNGGLKPNFKLHYYRQYVQIQTFHNNIQYYSRDKYIMIYPQVMRHVIMICWIEDV